MPEKQPDLSVTFLGRELSTPLVLASGIWGTTVSLLERAAAAGCGAVTAKSCGPTPRSGHVNPSCVDWGGGLLNAIGLANPGVDEEVGLLHEARARLQPRGVLVIASIFAGTAAEFGDGARRIARARPDCIEVNISCPNVEDSFGEPFAANAESAAAVTQYVKAAVADQAIPVIVKLAPNVPSVGRIAQAVVDAGADALCAINTMPGLVLDPYSGQPVLANRSGGISGPALKPIALKAVYDARKACPHTPIIGTGGVIEINKGELRFARFDQDLYDFLPASPEPFSHPGIEEVETELGPETGSHVDTHRNFCNAILHGEALVADGLTAIRGLELANGMIASHYSGQTIDFPLDRDDYFALLKRLQREERNA